MIVVAGIVKSNGTEHWFSKFEQYTDRISSEILIYFTKYYFS